jgi:hypothetical protein
VEAVGSVEVSRGVEVVDGFVLDAPRMSLISCATTFLCSRPLPAFGHFTGGADFHEADTFGVPFGVTFTNEFGISSTTIVAFIALLTILENISFVSFFIDSAFGDSAFGDSAFGHSEFALGNDLKSPFTMSFGLLSAFAFGKSFGNTSCTFFFTFIFAFAFSTSLDFFGANFDSSLDFFGANFDSSLDFFGPNVDSLGNAFFFGA